MASLSFSRLFDLLISARLVWLSIWIGLGLLTVALLAMMVTRWGQSRPLRKCVVLSLWAHVLMAVYATTVDIVIRPPGSLAEATVRVHAIDGFAPSDDADTWHDGAAPWEQSDAPLPRPQTLSPGRPQPEAPAAEPPKLSETAPRFDAVRPEELRTIDASSPAPAPPAVAQSPGGARPKSTKAAEAIEAPAAQRRERVQTPAPGVPEARRPEVPALSAAAPPPAVQQEVPASLLGPPSALPRLADAPVVSRPESLLRGALDSLLRPSSLKPAAHEARDPAALAAEPVEPGPGQRTAVEVSRQATTAVGAIVSRGTPEAASPDAELPTAPLVAVAPRTSEGEAHQPPAMYQFRVAPDRARLAERLGGSPETEAAVKAALTWLATHQSPDGRWDASEFGAGRETRLFGQDRGRAGTHADTGMTGLALLAFLGAGHTHTGGSYPEAVGKGLDYLLASQARDGSLGGQAEMFAFMYCHGMAGLALSEAYGMTGDPRLQGPVTRAVAYTLAAQNRASGGWRYRPSDQGDTSQLGWQLMFLKSAELAGIDVPVSAREQAARFLRSVQLGVQGGLASYRPGEQPSRTMTAEALVCRLFLGLSPASPAGREAADYLLGELPGQAPANHYYWYYATLGMYQLQGTAWQQWNRAVTTALVSSQRKDDTLAGSWDPDPLWGSYGGRIFSTALGALCLEVYYRFLPLYVEAAALEKRLQ